MYAPPQFSNAPDAPLPHDDENATHELAHVPEHVVPVDICVGLQFPTPSHPSRVIVCPLQVYVTPPHAVTPDVLAGAFVQLEVPATQ